MCLDRLKDINDIASRGTGYKIVRKNMESLYSCNEYIFNREKWNTDLKDININISNNRAYKSGFHIFRGLKDAVEYAYTFNCISSRYYDLWKIEYNDVVAFGLEEFRDSEQYCEVIVAKEIRFIRKINIFEILFAHFCK